MKQLLTIASIAVFAFVASITVSSCENPNYYDDDVVSATQPDGTPVDVVFTCNGFTASKTRASVTDVATRLDFVVFYGDNIAFEAHQVSTDENFGVLTAKLAPGDYSIVAIAHNGTAQAQISSATKVTFPRNHLTDTFAYGGNVTITDDDPGHDITLKRAVACFRLQTTDAIPDTVSQMKFYYLNGSSTLNPQTLQGAANSKQTEIFTVTDAQRNHAGQWDVYTFPKTKSGKATLTMQVLGLDKDNNEIYEKLFTDVEVERTYRTTYSGNFFGGETTAPGGSFQIKVDSTEWKDMPLVNY